MTRTTLVNAAAELFAERGLNGASLEDIAEAAGFTRGAIYSNFGGKDELLLAVLDHFLEVQLSTASEAVGAGGDLSEGAVAAGEAWQSSTSLTSSWPALALELRVSALRDPTVRERLVAAEHAARDRVAFLIQEELARRNLESQLPTRDLADICRATIEGLTQLAALDQDDKERYERLVGTLLLLLVEATTQPASKPRRAAAKTSQSPGRSLRGSATVSPTRRAKAPS